MPSRQADELTRLHRREALAIAAAAARRIRRLARTVDVADVDGWFNRAESALVGVVVTGHEAEAAATARYMRQHAAVEGRTLDPTPVAANRAQIATSLHVTGPVAFKTQMARSGAATAAARVMANTLVGSARRLVLAGERDTFLDGVRTSTVVAGYRRVTASDPCAFCAMLAMRGGVYKDQRSATRVVGRRGPRGLTGTLRGRRAFDEPFHDSCRCTFEALYEHEPEPADVIALRERWDQVTAGLDGPDAVHAWRRHLDPN